MHGQSSTEGLNAGEELAIRSRESIPTQDPTNAFWASQQCAARGATADEAKVALVMILPGFRFMGFVPQS